MPETVTVHKLDHRGREIIRYPGQLLEADEARILLRAKFDHDAVELPGLRLTRGDRMLETFYRQRWYNVFEIHAHSDDRLKGWYCNLTRPARFEAGHIWSEDLALDLLILPDRSWRLLDEAEYQALALTDHERNQVEQALVEIKRLVAEALAPFENLEP